MIHAKMEEKLQMKHRIKHLSGSMKSGMPMDPEHVPCHRSTLWIRCRRMYKLIVLICSVVTFGIYCYYYYSYLHAMKPSNLAQSASSSSSPRLILNQYSDHHYEHLDHLNSIKEGAGGINGEFKGNSNIETNGYEHYDRYNNYDRKTHHDQYYDHYSNHYISYQYNEYQFQQNYYHERYGYYHDYGPDNNNLDGNLYGNGNGEEYNEYNDTMLYCFQISLIFILFVICFTSFQMFGLNEVPTKHE